MKRIELSAPFLTLGILASAFCRTSASGVAASSLELIERAICDAFTDIGAKDDIVAMVSGVGGLNCCCYRSFNSTMTSRSSFNAWYPITVTTTNATVGSSQ